MKSGKTIVAALLLCALFASCSTSTHYRNLKKYRADRSGSNHTPGF